MKKWALLAILGAAEELIIILEEDSEPEWELEYVWRPVFYPPSTYEVDVPMPPPPSWPLGPPSSRRAPDMEDIRKRISRIISNGSTALGKGSEDSRFDSGGTDLLEKAGAAATILPSGATGSVRQAVSSINGDFDQKRGIPQRVYDMLPLPGFVERRVEPGIRNTKVIGKTSEHRKTDPDSTRVVASGRINYVED